MFLTVFLQIIVTLANRKRSVLVSGSVFILLGDSSLSLFDLIVWLSCKVRGFFYFFFLICVFPFAFLAFSVLYALCIHLCAFLFIFNTIEITY